MGRIRTYSEFWPYYLGEHSKPQTRAFHAWGIVVATLMAVFLGVKGLWAWIPAVLIVGYGFAWYSHFFIEKNRPATFQYPLWSFVSDFRMSVLYFLGKLPKNSTNQ